MTDYKLFHTFKGFSKKSELGSQLQPYVFSVKNLPGQLNIADASSPLTIEKANTRNIAEEYIRFVVNTAVP